MPSADELKTKLNASVLNPTHLEISDTSDGCGSKFEAIIVSEAFDGLGLLERQRTVNDIIAAEMESVSARP